MTYILGVKNSRCPSRYKLRKKKNDGKEYRISKVVTEEEDGCFSVLVQSDNDDLVTYEKYSIVAKATTRERKKKNTFSP